VEEAFRLSSDKEQSRLRAIRTFPAAAESFKLKKHDGGQRLRCWRSTARKSF
jgi:hypothetical protein